jgi:predicted nuclease of predicted toxin-antitoxin system
VRLLLDEHFSPEIARQLRDRNHDVVAAGERLELRGSSDIDLLAWAARERRAVLTENVADFVELHRRAIVTMQPHAGIVFTSAHHFPRTRRAIGRLVTALEGLITDHPGRDELRDQVWWL